MDARYEIKYVGRVQQLWDVIQWLEAHQKSFQRPFPDRQINNIYFDSDDLRLYQSSLDGDLNRKKLRYRWYGNEEPNKGQLEVKAKDGAFVSKEVYPTEALSLDTASSSWQQMVSEIWKAVPSRGQVWLDLFRRPVLINKYYRSYFVSWDQSLRITIDSRQRFYDQYHFSSMDCHQPIPMADTLVVEAKFSPRDSKDAQFSLRDFPLPISRFSKYVEGLRRIIG